MAVVDFAVAVALAVAFDLVAVAVAVAVVVNFILYQTTREPIWISLCFWSESKETWYCTPQASILAVFLEHIYKIRFLVIHRCLE